MGADDLAEIARLFNRISNETEALVAKLWPAITLVAEELLPAARFSKMKWMR